MTHWVRCLLAFVIWEFSSGFAPTRNFPQIVNTEDDLQMQEKLGQKLQQQKKIYKGLFIDFKEWWPPGGEQRIVTGFMLGLTAS